MPLLKRKPFTLLEPPKDLDPCELVFQIRFTKEIFRDYHDYLERINLYRQRVWTCKVAGKTNLTYEEALVSEQRATEKVQQFPKELVAHVLHTVQFSMLSLRDLVNEITTKVQECLSEGVELYGKRDNSVYLCQIVKVLNEGSNKTQYAVAWLDKDKNITGTSVVNKENLIRKKLPFTRGVLKSFIRESTSQNVPWILHEKLARKHGISTDPPDELRSRLFFQNGQIVRNKKRKRNEETKRDGSRKCRTKNSEIENDKLVEEPIKYPIDDMLVLPSADDPVFTTRPSPSRDFNVPMDFVGDLIMVWDFCSSFSRLLNLFPFSLEDFESAICHKDSTPVLLVESHSAILRLLINDEGDYFMFLEKRRHKSKMSLVNWTEYLCDFIEMIEVADLSAYTSTIKRGHYSLLDTHAKLGILRELVAQALSVDLFREKLDEIIEQRQALGAKKRGEAIEAAKKRREEKESLKAVSASNGNHTEQNGDIVEKGKEKLISSPRNSSLDTSEKKLVESTVKKVAETREMNGEVLIENGKALPKREALKMLRQPRADNGKESTEKNSGEHRKEYLEREMEKRSIRTNPLGKDKYYNRYWFFRSEGRIFVENSDLKGWGYYTTKEEIDALMGSLNRKGERERALQRQLEKQYRRICLQLQKRSKDLIHKIAVDEGVLRRSTRVRAPPRENPGAAFLRYVNKWKED